LLFKRLVNAFGGLPSDVPALVAVLIAPMMVDRSLEKVAKVREQLHEWLDSLPAEVPFDV
jgi:hypothetical protein